MATYAIGDLQGCYSNLKSLLLHIQFNPVEDTLWFTGDLVNRGPESLEALRFVKSLGEKHVVVLGNHDLHLLAVAYGVRSSEYGDTLDEILAAPDKNELIDWLRHRPLLHCDEALQCVITHAGIPPLWDLNEASLHAEEVERVLRCENPGIFLKQMFGNEPDHWDDALPSMDKLRCIVNYFTRMRLCYADGRLDFAFKDRLGNKPENIFAWFDVPNRKPISQSILFGHWAALKGKTPHSNIHALDTGCIWGNCLTAMRLEDGKRFKVNC